MVIRNKKSGHTQEISETDWQKMKERKMPEVSPGATHASLYEVVDPTRLKKANTPEELKVHTGAPVPTKKTAGK